MTEKKQTLRKASAQLPSNITRRDFIGATLAGSGSALLMAKAPAFIQSAQAQSSPAYALLGPEWTGPGGIGDYSQSNGNTHQVVNAAHSLRDGYWTSVDDKVSDTGEEYDLVVVGGGFAGLMSAYQFLKDSGDDARVLILDNHPIFGGEAKQNEVEVDGYHLHAPQGSNMCLWPAAAAKAGGIFYHPVWEEVGLPMGTEPDAPTWVEKPEGSDKDLPYAKEHYAHMMIYRDFSRQGFFWPDPDNPEINKMSINPWMRGYKDMDWPDEVKRELTMLDEFLLTSHPEYLESWLDSQTYTEYLTNVVGITRQEVFDYLSPMIASYGTGLGCDAISALGAKQFFSPGTATAAEAEQAESAGGADFEAVSFPGGNSGIARHIVKKMLPNSIEGSSNFSDILYGRVNFGALDSTGQNLRIRVSSTAIDVRHDGSPETSDKVLVSYLDNRTGQIHRVSGSAAIMAGGQWMNKHVVRDSPDDLLEAMGTFQHAPMLVANVVVRQWRFMEQLGITSARWFGDRSWFTNVRAPLSLNGEHMPHDPDKPTVLTFYIPFTLGVSDQGLPYNAQSLLARTQLFAMSYKEIETNLRSQLTAMFGRHGFDHERDIGAIITNRWGHAYVIPQVGFFHGLDGKPAPREIVRRGYGRIRFAHSELTGDQLWSTACEEGERAAKQVLEFV